MELHAVEIVFGNRSGEIHAVMAGGDGVFVWADGVAMHKIEMAVLFNADKQRMVWRVTHFVPAHVRQRQATVRDKIRLPTH